jgi:hypothetical protein
MEPEPTDLYEEYSDEDVCYFCGLLLDEYGDCPGGPLPEEDERLLGRD